MPDEPTEDSLVARAALGEPARMPEGRTVPVTEGFGGPQVGEVLDVDADGVATMRIDGPMASVVRGGVLGSISVVDDDEPEPEIDLADVLPFRPEEALERARAAADHPAGTGLAPDEAEALRTAARAAYEAACSTCDEALVVYDQTLVDRRAAADEGDQVAKDDIYFAEQAVNQAFRDLDGALCRSIAAGCWARGDVVRTPHTFQAPQGGSLLTVAEVLDPPASGPGDLSMMWLSADGGRIVTGTQHQPDLDDDGKPLPVTGPFVLCEKWGGIGFQIRGAAHPKSRCVVDVDRAG